MYVYPKAAAQSKFELYNVLNILIYTSSGYPNRVFPHN